MSKIQGITYEPPVREEFKMPTLEEMMAMMGGGPGGPGGPGFPFGNPGPAPDPIYENRVLECDDVVVSGGRKPRTDVAEAFRGIAPVVTVIGDALTVSIIKRATYSGYKAAMEL